jgi:hypothetical protein
MLTLTKKEKDQILGGPWITYEVEYHLGKRIKKQKIQGKACFRYSMTEMDTTFVILDENCNVLFEVNGDLFITCRVVAAKRKPVVLKVVPHEEVD